MISGSIVDAFRSRLTLILASTLVGVYALILIGATVSLTEGAAACSSWPTCNGAWIVSLEQPAAVIALVHRYVSVLVGAVLLTAGVVAWRRPAPGAVRWLLTVTIALYPFQIGLGALTAIVGGSTLLSAAHLVLAMGIFVGVLLGFVRWLEFETQQVSSEFGTGGQPAGHDEMTEQSPAAAGERNIGSGHTTGGRRARIRAYGRLVKPRLMWLLCFVALAGIGLAVATTGRPVSGWVVLGTLLGGVLAIGASGTFNHVLEQDVDQQMARTADRPVATHRVSTPRAVLFGACLTVGSLASFLGLVNPLAAGLGLFAIFFYTVVYTIILKPNTVQNIVIGGAVGALPAVIGWAAVTGSIGIPALLLGLVIFLWTPAHFYNLALAYKDDYARGGFPMLPLVRGERVTRQHIVLYFGATLLAAALLGAVGPLGWPFVASLLVFSAVFLGAIIGLYRRQTRTAALRSFHASNAFLGVVMLVIIVETLVL